MTTSRTNAVYSRAFYFLAATIFCCSLAQAAQPSLLKRNVNESVRDFAQRVIGGSDQNITQAVWNGRPFIFVDSGVTQPIPGQTETEDDRVLVALEQTPDGTYRRIAVTTGEEEGGEARIEAIGFANADHDPADELIVLISWNVQHADVNGTLYEVRIFDDAVSSPGKLTYLKKISEHFGKDSCDCDRDDGPPEHFAFKTIASIKRELKRLGY